MRFPVCIVWSSFFFRLSFKLGFAINGFRTTLPWEKHNAMSPARTLSRTGDEEINHEAIAPPTKLAENSKFKLIENCLNCINYSGFPKETPELKFRLRFFFFRSATVCNYLSNTHARRFLLMSKWHGVMADGEEFMRWKISTNIVDGCKTDTKCEDSVHGRPTLKDEERFRNGLVRKPYERSLYEHL